MTVFDTRCQRRTPEIRDQNPLRVVVPLLVLLGFIATHQVGAAPITSIAVDGDFSDWAAVPTRTDPDAASTGEPLVLHDGIPDVHDTDHKRLDAVPSFRDHPDVDILEYKFTHDESNLYAYFKADGIIGNTQNSRDGRAGRYYVIVTIDVDNDDSTGYFLHGGGYYPTSGTDRYDMNMEAEFYDGSLNTGHYLSHDAVGESQLIQDFKKLTGNTYPRGRPGPYTPGPVDPAPGTYNEYTQWVYDRDDNLILVDDRGPVVPGIMSVALSADGHEIEIGAPFKGFLNDSTGRPNMALGRTIDISFSLEASGELAPSGGWASDTADPIVGYYLAAFPEPTSLLLAEVAAAGLLSVRRRVG